MYSLGAMHVLHVLPLTNTLLYMTLARTLYKRLLTICCMQASVDNPTTTSNEYKFVIANILIHYAFFNACSYSGNIILTLSTKSRLLIMCCTVRSGLLNLCFKAMKACFSSNNTCL